MADGSLTEPDFIIAGAGKSGSTSLWNYLKEHPEICMARDKEPFFFSRVQGRRHGGDWKAPTRSGQYDRGLEWYRSLFAGCGSNQHLGEASVSYFFVEDTPELLHEHRPGVKLLFILRDPVDRFYSHYWQARKSAKDVPEDFHTLVEHPEHPYFKLFEWVSSYRVHLQRFLEYFSRDQVKILFHQDLVSEPLTVLNDCYEFIDVPRGFVPENLDERFNPAALPRFRSLQKFLDTMRGMPVKKYLPVFLRSGISRLIGTLSGLNEREIDYPPLEEADRKRLIRIFHDDVDFVQELTERSLPEWYEIQPGGPSS